MDPVPSSALAGIDVEARRMPLGKNAVTLMDSGLVTEAQLRSRDTSNWWILESAAVYKCLEQRRITVGQALNMGAYAAYAISRGHVLELVDKGFLTMDQVLDINEDAYATFCVEGVKELIIDGFMSVDLAISGLTVFGRNMLWNSSAIKAIRAGRRTVEDIIYNSLLDVWLWDYSMKCSGQKT